MATEIKTCAACSTKVTCYLPNKFNVYHKCSLAGQPSGDKCPDCGHDLVYVVGPFQTFRGCSQYKISGCRGKKNAPRGKYATKSETVQESKEEIAKSMGCCESCGNPTMNCTCEISLTTTQEQVETMEKATELSKVAANVLWNLISPAALEIVQETARSAAKGEVANLASTRSITIDVKSGDQVLGKIEGAHKLAARVLKLISAGFRNILLVGPAGSGKTTLARDVAKGLGRAFASVSCTGGMSESALTGRAIPNLATGDVKFQSTDFVRLYESGGVFLLDEGDAMDPNVGIVVNSALANGHMPLPNRTENPCATRHDDFVLIVAANTYGTGADRQYVGRNQLDAAFLDRFVGAVLECDYDRDLETALVSGVKQGTQILNRCWNIREKVQALKLRRIWGTRSIVAVAKLVSADDSLDEAIRACMQGWTVDEMTKVGVSA